MAEAATYERDGHVATITYNRPDALNAIDAAMRQALNAAWTRFREDTEAWVAIVTGAGRAFCAGADLRNPRGAVGEWPGSFWEIPTLNSFESGWETWKPTIEAVRMGETMRRVVAQSEDAAEGRAARAEGREPHWRAR